MRTANRRTQKHPPEARRGRVANAARSPSIVSHSSFGRQGARPGGWASGVSPGAGGGREHDPNEVDRPWRRRDLPGRRGWLGWLEHVAGLNGQCCRCGTDGCAEAPVHVHNAALATHLVRPGFPYRFDTRALLIRVSLQYGAPDLRGPSDDRDHLPCHELRRWDGDHRQETAAVGIGRGEVLDVIEGSNGPIGLGCVAGYFDRYVRLESEDFNGEANAVVIPEFDLGNLGVRHESVILSNVYILGKVSERLPDSGKVAFALVEMKSLGGYGMCVGDTADRSEDVSEIEQGVGVLAQQVRLRGQRHRRACEFRCLGVVATVGEDPGRQSLAE